MAEVTNHAIKRIRQRLGLNKTAACREATRALDGLAPRQCTGKLRKYLDHLAYTHRCRYRVTPNAVYVFTTSDVLVTVWALPNEYKKTTLALWKKHKEIG